jgi:hypothetical protein
MAEEIIRLIIRISGITKLGVAEKVVRGVSRNAHQHDQLRVTLGVTGEHGVAGDGNRGGFTDGDGWHKGKSQNYHDKYSHGEKDVEGRVMVGLYRK